jgi:hypothetical protein
MNIPREALAKVTTGAKTQLDVISKNYQIVAANLEEIRENQNQQMKALATIYELLEEQFKGSFPGSELPKPKIDMKIEED